MVLRESGVAASETYRFAKFDSWGEQFMNFHDDLHSWLHGTPKIVLYPDPILSQPCQPVPHNNELIFQVCRKMLDMMYEARGIGLAAPQVGLPYAFFVLNTLKHDKELVFINPKVVRSGGRTTKMAEGCLSMPGITGEVERQHTIMVEAKDLDWQDVRVQYSGLYARACMHEIDHLSGIMFFDRSKEKERILKEFNEKV